MDHDQPAAGILDARQLERNSLPVAAEEPKAGIDVPTAGCRRLFEAAPRSFDHEA
ncbi:MAG TPA: hypothetical protein VGI73_06975 [Solirubrobacterales bacterium]